MATDNSKDRMRAPAGLDVLAAVGTFHGLQRRISLRDFLDMAEQMPIERSGSGMTRCIITPMFRRFLLERRAAKQREAAGGRPECGSPFDITDGMASFYNDINKIARGNEQGDDMMSGRRADKGTS